MEKNHCAGQVNILNVVLIWIFNVEFVAGEAAGNSYKFLQY